MDLQSGSDDAFLDELFEAALGSRAAGATFDVESLVRGRPHLRERILDIVDLAGNLAVTSPATVPGLRFANYRILTQLGRGGQATVYLAEDTRLARNVALKILDPGGARSKESIERFRREAEITSRLDHPGIGVVYESGESAGSLWIAMRHVAGSSLAHEIAVARNHAATADPGTSAGRMAPAELTRLLAIFEKAGRALHVAHEHGVIHRDIKPGNIMVGEDDEPVVLDFGLAHEIESGAAALTLTGALVGTPAYMSPEQVAGNGTRVDRRTDVYALGVSLYECLTLNRPFDTPTREGLYHAILTKDPPDVRACNPSVSKDLEVVLETAMEKDRERRYQTALALAEDLRRVRLLEPIVARPVGPLGRLHRWARRNPSLATALGGLFLALTVGLGATLYLRGREARALVEVTKERDLKDYLLKDYDRLGDLSRLDALRPEAAKFWPCEPSKVAAMRAWVEQGADIEKRLSGHREVLARLRASALPYTDEDRAADLAAHTADHAELAKLRTRRAETAGVAAQSRAASRASSQPSVEDIRARLGKLDADIARLDANVHERATYRFSSTAEQFKHDTTAKLVADLTAFVDPDRHKGLLADVRYRLAFAESVERETIVKHKDAWKSANEAMAANPKYHGLSIEPQLGLIPIGEDPRSHLWEFVHLQTVAPVTDPVPKRGQDGRLIVTEDMGIVFVLLPGGTFRMGAIKPLDEDTPMNSPNVDPEAEAKDGPVIEVTLEPFFMSKYEMTQGQWLRIVGKNPSHFRPGMNVGGKIIGLRNPVEEVSWDDCDKWLGRLGLVLPTAAQWEYGARGGTTTPRWTGLGTDGLSKAANIADLSHRPNGRVSLNAESWDDGYEAHAPVGSFDPNPFGLHDVLGNILESCRDWYLPNEVTLNDVKLRAGDGLRVPSGSVTQYRVIRGGSFGSSASQARSVSVLYTFRESRSLVEGVRPARPCNP